MTTAVLALGLFLASAPVPASPAKPLIAPTDARAIFLLPMPKEGLPSLRLFLEKAGKKAPLLKPTTVERLFKAALGADLFDLSALDAAGIDVAQPITLSLWKSQWIACFTEKPIPESLTESNEPAALAPLPLPLNDSEGSSKKQSLKPVQFDEEDVAFRGFADTSGTWLSGRVQRDSFTCAVSGNEDQRPLLKQLAERLKGRPSEALNDLQSLAHDDGTAALLGYFQKREKSIGVRFFPKESGLVAQGKLHGGHEFLSKDLSKKANLGDGVDRLQLDAPLWMNLVLSSKVFGSEGPGRQAIQRTLRHLCPACPDDARLFLQKLLLEALKGPVAFAISGVDAREPRGSIHQIRQSFIASIQGADRLQAALDALKPHLPQSASGMPLSEGGVQVDLSGAPIWFGLQGTALYFGNDRSLLEQALVTLKKKPVLQAPSDALRLRLDGTRLAQLLQGISMMDMSRGELFASLFVLKMEASSLLRSAEEIVLTANPDGSDVRFEARFEMERAASRETSKPSNSKPPAERKR